MHYLRIGLLPNFQHCAWRAVEACGAEASDRALVPSDPPLGLDLHPPPKQACAYDAANTTTIRALRLLLGSCLRP